jgi:serine phosphatase RsbU (regulator of sigma subunit)
VLEPGDVLLAYSDGVLETLNRSDEEFGMARIEAQLRAAALIRNDEPGNKNSAESILFSMLGSVQDFAASQPLVDDLSLVVIRRDP